MANAQPPLLDDKRAKARDYLLTNLLVLPGLGSILARKKVGWLQALLALTGFALTVMWFTSFIKMWIHTEEFPADGGPFLKWGLIGVGLFGLAWLWALATGLSVVRHAKRR